MIDAIKGNYLAILDRMSTAAIKSKRDPGDIRLVVVTKSQPLPVIQAVIEAGATQLGENYADEALVKIQTFSQFKDVKWHMIGHVQSRKARLVAGHFDMVHSLDSLKLADKLSQSCLESATHLSVLLELNLAGEETKSGWMVSEEAGLASFGPVIEQINTLPRLKISGLMTMPPLSSDPEDSRPYFRKLFQFRGFLANKFPGISWSELSMGTSADFEIAIEEGATMVRIGRAILGPRQRPLLKS